MAHCQCGIGGAYVGRRGRGSRGNSVESEERPRPCQAAALELVAKANLSLEQPKTALCEARTHDLQIMRLTR